MASRAFSSLLADSSSDMLTAANILEEKLELLVSNEDDGVRDERAETLKHIIYRLNRNAHQLQGALIGMYVSESQVNARESQ